MKFIVTHDTPATRLTLAHILEKEVQKVNVVKHNHGALVFLGNQLFAFLISDLNASDMDPLSFQRQAPTMLATPATNRQLEEQIQAPEKQQ